MNNSIDEEDFTPKSNSNKKSTKKARIIPEDDEDCDEAMEDDNDDNGNGGGKGIGRAKAGLLGTVLTAMTMGLLCR